MSINMPDLRELPLDRFCNFVWWWLTRNARDAQAIEKTRALLWRPPKSAANQPIDPRSPWSPQAEQAGFAALRAGLGGKPTQSAPEGPGKPVPAAAPPKAAQTAVRRIPIKRGG